MFLMFRLLKHTLYTRGTPLFLRCSASLNNSAPPFIISRTNGTMELYFNNNALQRPPNEHSRTFTKRHVIPRYIKNITQKT